MQEVKTDLIQALEHERERRQMNHNAFSTLLGIHKSQWHRIRTRERPPSLDVLTVILQRLPELGQEVCSYMVQRESPFGNNNDEGREQG